MREMKASGISWLGELPSNWELRKIKYCLQERVEKNNPVIKAAFAPYYTTTLLANSVTPNAIYDLEATIDAYALFDPADIEAANDILYSQKVTGKQKQVLK